METLAGDIERLAARAPALFARSDGAGSSAAPSSSLPAQLDALIARLEAARSSGSSSTPSSAELASAVAALQTTAAARTKEYYNALSRASKTLERRLASQPPLDASIAEPALFTARAPQEALLRTVWSHLLRAGEREAAQTLLQEAGFTAPSHADFQALSHILRALNSGDLKPAIAWATEHAEWLSARGSLLEFALHRSACLRLALGAAVTSTAPPAAPAEEWSDARSTLGSDDAHDGFSPTQRAMLYASEHLAAFHGTHLHEIQRLLTFILYIPPDSPVSLEMLHIQVPAPYRSFLDAQAMHAPFLAPLLEAEWCAKEGVPREAPLRLAVEIGAGGALNRIAKVRAVMKQSGNEWSQADELPVEIPLPPHLRFHSTFACPVSKEQGTEENPPMLMACGHVVAQESLTRISKGGSRVKCPYCPSESAVSMATRVYF